MGEELNQTYIVLEGFIGVSKYRYLYFLMMFTMYILILCSNSTIVGLIVFHKNLHEPMYIFIAGLLMNSLLYTTVVYPKLLIDFLSDKQLISHSACLFQWFAYYSLGAAELFLLAAMSYDRYVSILNPLRYTVIMKKTTISVILVSAFLLPVFLMSVPTALNANTKLCHFKLQEILCHNTVYNLYCVKPVITNIYGLVVFVNMGIFSLLFIFFTYIRIFVIVYQSGPAVRAKAAQTCFPHLIVLINTSCLSTFGVLLYRLEANFPMTVRLVITLQTVIYRPLFNPIIYGLKMQVINNHFKRLFSLCEKFHCDSTLTCLTVIVYCHNKPKV